MRRQCPDTETPPCKHFIQPPAGTVLRSVTAICHECTNCLRNPKILPLTTFAAILFTSSDDYTHTITR